MKPKDDMSEWDFYKEWYKGKTVTEENQKELFSQMIADFTHSQLKEQEKEIERLRGCKITQRQSDRIEQLKEENERLKKIAEAKQFDANKIRQKYSMASNELQSKQKEIERLKRMCGEDLLPEEIETFVAIANFHDIINPLKEQLQSKQKELETALEMVRALKNELKLQNKTAYTWNLITKAEQLIK
jgi:TolA-binding protein